MLCRRGCLKRSHVVREIRTEVQVERAKLRRARGTRWPAVPSCRDMGDE